MSRGFARPCLSTPFKKVTDAHRTSPSRSSKSVEALAKQAWAHAAAAWKAPSASSLNDSSPCTALRTDSESDACCARAARSHPSKTSAQPRKEAALTEAWGWPNNLSSKPSLRAAFASEARQRQTHKPQKPLAPPRHHEMTPRARYTQTRRRAGPASSLKYWARSRRRARLAPMPHAQSFATHPSTNAARPTCLLRLSKSWHNAAKRHR